MNRFDEIESLNSQARRKKVLEQKHNQDLMMQERQRKLERERQEEVEHDQKFLEGLSEEARREHTKILQERVKEREK